PTKVTIFDVDYVIAKISNDEVVAMPDYCTHKGAALSEGRVTARGNFQCAYHGWSFNGKTGDCIEIPQIIQNKDEGKQTSARIPSRACSTAVPAQIHDGMVWL
ncbi:ISP domain-containing protein, partial [Fragilariopsis cylindrus CCMP1102]